MALAWMLLGAERGSWLAACVVWGLLAVSRSAANLDHFLRSAHCTLESPPPPPPPHSRCDWNRGGITESGLWALVGLRRGFAVHVGERAWKKIAEGGLHEATWLPLPDASTREHIFVATGQARD